MAKYEAPRRDMVYEDWYEEVCALVDEYGIDIDAVEEEDDYSLFDMYKDGMMPEEVVEEIQ